MKFYIEKLALWPVDNKNTPHFMNFQNGKINIIHGRSGTGKSSIISIIDYCLGAGRCSIPVGIIRDSVEWFGLVINVDESRFLLARRTPRKRQVSNEFFLSPMEDEVPNNLSPTHNEAQFKQAFNNLTRLTNVLLTDGEEAGRFDGRPSYRDLAAFNFLPQHIVANPNTLFYKADSYEHKERLKKVMPFALGIIDSEYVIKEREKAQLQRQHDELVKRQESKRQSLMSWEAEVERLWGQAVELGLVRNTSPQTHERKVALLKAVNDDFIAGRLESALSTPDYGFTNQKYKESQTAEEHLQARVDSLRREIRGYERLSQRALTFSDAVVEEEKRVISLDWLKNRLGGESECVVCGSSTNQLHSVISKLENDVRRINKFSQAMFENPIVDKEIEAAKSQLLFAQEQLHSARMERLKLQKTEAPTRDSLSQVYVLMGRIQAFLISFAAVTNTDDLGVRISDLADQIRVLDEFFQKSGKAAREWTVDQDIGVLIEKYADGFGLERRGKISLDKAELTLSFCRDSDAKKEYLWEVGSGANWMGYHIATFLALHEFLSRDELSQSPVFRFIVIDQPSQVYFPSAASGVNQLDADKENLEKLKEERDVDVNATKRIFEMLEIGLKAAKHRYQIIVLEHADDSIWGPVEHTVEVANWKSEGQGLIPRSWMT